MLLKLIACNVFLREASLCAADSPHTIDPEFLELGEHIRPDLLREAIQARIDAAETGKAYDAVLLLYGLCGNAGVGLRARSRPLVLPRAHDCCTVLLGSRDRFREIFQDNPSMPFSSPGYMERGSYFIRMDESGCSVQYGDQYAALVEQYGEDDAKFIWESMHPRTMEQLNNKVVFIDSPALAALGCAERFAAAAAAEGKECLRVEGSDRLIRALLHGRWDPADFLVLQPGQKTAGVYDWSEIVRASSEA